MPLRPRFSARPVSFCLILAFSVILNLLSWNSTAFSDFYVDHLFPVLAAPLAHFSALFSFSLGEVMLALAVIWLAVFAADLLYLLQARIRRKTAPRLFRKFPAVTAWLVNLVFLVMTLNCVILYHVTPLEASLPGYGKPYSVEELAQLRDVVVENCNRLSASVPRDENQTVLYEGGEAAMAKAARLAIENEASADLSSSPDGFSASSPKNAPFRRLLGWSTTPKGLSSSYFISQQYMQGYYFPFAMEATYNTVMNIMNKPFTMCHELSHTHGFIYEDEANLIGFLACIHSDDPIFQYSGWLGVLNYVDNAFYANVSREEYLSHPTVLQTVRSDNEFLTDAAWEEVNQHAVLDTETVKAAADTYLDTTLKANGISSGKASYEHVVGLLLEYFDGNFPDSVVG